MIRRPVAAVVAIVLFGEAIGIALLNWVLGVIAGHQKMSMAGVDPHTMEMSSKAGGVVFGLYFALCAVAALLIALRDRAPSGFWRIVLISAAVVHGLLGALMVGLIGWTAFAYMMVVFGLILLTLMMYDRPERPAGATPERGAPDGGGTGADGTRGTVDLRKDAARGDVGEGGGAPAPVTP
ncbi:hypothetical protein AB0C59_34445 [Streptomyces sp. NPDC048664]|uniref:hypothetical protein n=1 Tax=Streptomyces sp. NPDC048664 TaxID=3154505 RepID=UPI00343295A3